MDMSPEDFTYLDNVLQEISIVDLDIFNDISEVISSPEINFEEICQKTEMTWLVGELKGLDDIVGGLRFRYQSEIEKNSFSYLKTEQNKSPEIKVIAKLNAALRLDLVDGNNDPHFYSFYTDSTHNTENFQFHKGGTLVKKIVQSNVEQIIKLHPIGIKKLSKNESLAVIKNIYPSKTEEEVNQFYNRNKNVVKIRAMLCPDQNYHERYKIPLQYSKPIKSTSRMENLKIKINYISPREISLNEKTIIVVLEKKVSELDNMSAYFTGKDFPKKKCLELIFKDGQTFVYKIPKIQNKDRFKTMFEMTNMKSTDKVPIFFAQNDEDIRKRKNTNINPFSIPLKRVHMSEPNPNGQCEQVAESESANNHNLEFDGLNSRNNISHGNVTFIEHLTSNNFDFNHVNNNEDNATNNDSDIQFDHVAINHVPEIRIPNSVKSNQDSGCGTSVSNENHSESTKESEDDYSDENDGDSDDSSDEDDYTDENESDYESDIDNSEESNESIDSDEDGYECDGRRKRVAQIPENRQYTSIKIPPKIAQKYELNINHVQSTQKILSEIAKVGHDFAFNGDKNAVFERIKTCLPVIFTLQDDVGDTPLHNAMLQCKVEAAEEILEIVCKNCIWALDLVNTSNQTVLCLAPACQMPVTFVQKLLNAGCKLNVRDNLDRTPITYAIQYQETDILDLFLGHASDHKMLEILTRPDDVYYSPLHEAITSSYVEGVELLLEYADVNELGKLREESALHMAIDKDIDIRIVELLVNHSQIRINPINSDRNTPYDLAIQKGLFEIADLLKEYGGEIASNLEMDIETQSSDMLNEDEDELMSNCRSEANHKEILMQPESVEIVDLTLPESTSSNCQELIDKMRQMSLKGPIMDNILNVLINANLSIDEATAIVKPEIRLLIQSSQNKSQLTNNLKRFNCLPDTLSELYDKLRNQTNRKDLVDKIEKLVMESTSGM